MSRSKLTPSLASRAREAAPGDLLDVVIELVPPASAGEPADARGAISTRKAAFQRDLAPVEEALRQAGGQLLASVWLNHTLRARIPAGSIEKLAELAAVHTLDVPHPMRAEAG
jgi:hypothetical protein